MDGVQERVRAAQADFVGRAAPGLDEVLARGMVLTAVAYRGWSEVRERTAAQKAETARRLVRWIETQRVSGALEPDERRILSAEVGTVDPAECMAAAWRVEGAAVMVWAARLAEMPGYWELAQLPQVLGVMDDVPRGARDAGPLRPESEVVGLMHCAMDVLALLERHGDDLDRVRLGAYAKLGRYGRDRELIERAAFERAKATRWLTGIGASYADAAVPLGKRVLV